VTSSHRHRRQAAILRTLIVILLSCAGALAQTNAVRVEFTGDPSRTTIAGAFRHDGILYVSLSDLLRIVPSHPFRNEATHKIEIVRGSVRIKITAGSPFVVLTDNSGRQSVAQLPSSVLFGAGAYFLPLEASLPLFPSMFGLRGFFSPSENVLHFGGGASVSSYDIPSVSLQQKANGMVIRIAARKQLPEYENWLRADGWLYVTIADARADTATINAVRPSGIVKKILAVQSPASVQLTFRLAGATAATEITQDQNSNDLLLVIRTPAREKKTEPVPPPAPTVSSPAPSTTPAAPRRQENATETSEHRNRWKLDTIVLDAGHGGHDPGSIGVTGLPEKTITLGIVLKLGNLITRNLPGVRVVYTRKDDRFVELDKRGKIANEAGGKLFISVHANSLPRKPNPTRGFEVYLLRPGRTEEAVAIAERENSVIALEEGYEERYKQLTEENFILVTMAQSAYVKASEVFADLTQKEMASRTGIPNRGVKQAGFYVLVGAAMPNVLVETAYLSNRQDERFLKSDAGQLKIAEALLSAIKSYKKEYEKLLLEGTDPQTGE